MIQPSVLRMESAPRAVVTAVVCRGAQGGCVCSEGCPVGVSAGSERCTGAVISRPNAVRCTLGCRGCDCNCTVALSSISTFSPIKAESATAPWVRVSSTKSARWPNSRSNSCKTAWIRPASAVSPPCKRSLSLGYVTHAPCGPAPGPIGRGLNYHNAVPVQLERKIDRDRDLRPSATY